jgi:hypothetical protein
MLRGVRTATLAQFRDFGKPLRQAARRRIRILEPRQPLESLAFQ